MKHKGMHPVVVRGGGEIYRYLVASGWSIDLSYVKEIK